MDGSENISFTWKLGYNLMATRENEEDESPVFRGLFLPGGNSGHVMMPLKMDPEQVQIPKKWALGPAEDIQERRRTVIGRTVTTMDSEGNVILTMGYNPGQSTRSSYSGRRAPMPFVPRHSVSGTTSTVRAYQTDRLGMLSAGTKLYLSTSRLQRERKSYQSYWRRKDWLSALSDEERRNLRKQWLKAVSEHGETMSLLDFAYGNLPHEGQLAAIERGVRWTTLSRKPFGLEQSSFPPWEPLLNLFVPPSGTNFSSARIQGLKTWLVLRTSSIQLFRNHNLK